VTKESFGVPDSPGDRAVPALSGPVAQPVAAPRRGGLSTFSTMQVEILKMLSAHAWGLAAGYITASIVAGYAPGRWLKPSGNIWQGSWEG
jgi:hypothetical protein